jgi:pimeloyl-ACP methyl ester carboxylesterase
MDLDGETFRLTVVLVAASLCLVLAGLAGLGASVGLAGVFVLAAGGLSAVRERLSGGPVVFGHDLGTYAAVLWLAPLAAAAASLLFLGATPGELLTLGGLFGLAGMINYFLRPVYRAGYSLLRLVS